MAAKSITSPEGIFYPCTHREKIFPAFCEKSRAQVWKQGQEKGTLGLYLLGHIDWGKFPPLKKNAPSKKSKLIQENVHTWARGKGIPFPWSKNPSPAPYLQKISAYHEKKFLGYFIYTDQKLNLFSLKLFFKKVSVDSENSLKMP